MRICPLVPTLAVTALAMVVPAFQFKLDTNGDGVGCPVGQIERNDEPVVSVTVTFSATASASAGTPANPTTGTSRVVSGPHGVEYGPKPASRESRTRTGTTEWKRSPINVADDGADSGPSPATLVGWTVHV